MTDNENNSGDGINREYKDRLFKFIFGNPRHKDWTLTLLNGGRDRAAPGSRCRARVNTRSRWSLALKPMQAD